MKKNIVMIAFVAVLAISFCQTAFAAPVWTMLDYNDDGIYEARYQVTDHYSPRRGEFIVVVYKDLSCNYLGEEVWVEGSGIVKDTFEPWTYPFPT